MGAWEEILGLGKNFWKNFWKNRVSIDVKGVEWRIKTQQWEV